MFQKRQQVNSSKLKPSFHQNNDHALTSVDFTLAYAAATSIVCGCAQLVRSNAYVQALRSCQALPGNLW